MQYVTYSRPKIVVMLACYAQCHWLAPGVDPQAYQGIQVYVREYDCMEWVFTPWQGEICNNVE